MGEKKEKKETSKGVRIFIIILLTPLFVYFMAMVILGSKKAFESIANGDTSMLFALLFVLALAILCGYGIIKNISKLRSKELTAEQLQKRKKRNTILGLSSVLAVVLVIVVMFGSGNISESNEKEQMISKIKEYQDNGYLELSDTEYQKLETSSNSEIKERLNKIENNIKLQKEYNEKYSSKLDEIYAKEIKVELYPYEDTRFMYRIGEKYAKGQVEFVTIDKYSNNIAEIYYSVEINLAVTNKYNGSVSRDLVKKYYKIPYLRDIDKTQEINNYNDQVIQDELNNIIDGKTKVVLARPSKNNNYKYQFLHVQE